MKWSLLDRHRGALMILLGFAFLLNPFLVGALDIGDPDYYRYEPAPVTFHENGTMDVNAHVQEVDSEIACLQVFPMRSCMLERAIHAHGGLTYDGTSAPHLYSDYEYVYIYGKGFLEPIAEELANGTVHYTLGSVPQTEALRDVATPFDRASTPIRTAIKTGAYETSDEIAGANELIQYRDAFYVVHLTRGHWEAGERRPLVVALQWIVGVVGAVLVLRGQRRRVTTPR